MENRTDIKNNKKKKKRRILISVFSTIGVIVALCAGGLFYLKSSLDEILIPSENATPVSAHKKDNDYMINFLLMGVDNDSEREQTGLDGKRTDSLMIVSLNTKTTKATVYNIPRDTATVIYDKNNKPITINGKYFNKINVAYEHGEEESTMNTVEHLFPGLEIDYFGTFNFLSFKGIVDSIGGIDIDVPVDIYDYQLNEILVKAGQQTLNGDQALDMARARYQDNDIERGYRQQMVMEAIASKMLSNLTITQVLDIMNSIKGNLVTNLSIVDVKDLFNSVSGKDFSFEKVETAWSPFEIDGQSMVLLPSAAREIVIKEINSSIDRDISINQVMNDTSGLQIAMNDFELSMAQSGELSVTSNFIDSFLNESEFPPILITD